jgi:urease accessory protein
MRTRRGTPLNPTLFLVLVITARYGEKEQIEADRQRPAATDWILWQLADSAFPSGGFAHSGGLEAAWQNGEITNRADFADFLEAALHQLGHSSLPFVHATHAGPARFEEIDLFCDAFLSNHVGNRASRAQGQSFLASTERAFSGPSLKSLRSEILAKNLPGHFASVFGVVTRVLNLDTSTTARLFTFNQLRGWMSSAVRLGIIGPLEAQSIQANIAPTAERVVTEPSDLSLENIFQTAPLIDLFQGTQDRLYSRLFQS